MIHFLGGINLDETELKEIPGLPGFFASKAGNIWKILKGRPRNQEKSKTIHRLYHGRWYAFIVPAIYGKGKNYLRIKPNCGSRAVHRLMLLTFCPIENSELFQVNHINRNTFDNRIENLEWVTCKENIRHAKETSLPKPYKELRSEHIERLKSLRLSSHTYEPQDFGSWLRRYDSDAIICELSTNPGSCKEIAEKLNVSIRAVRYWQEKAKVKRPKPPTLAEKINSLLKNGETYTPNQIAEIIGVRVTSIHAVLRKLKQHERCL